MMKKLLFALLINVMTGATYAQVKSQPVRTNTITKPPTMVIKQPSTIASKNLKPVADLSIIIRGVQKRNATWYADYTVKNNGTISLPLKDITVQAYVLLASADGSVDKATPAGASIVDAVGILEPGKEYQGTRHFSYHFQSGESYKYFLEVQLTKQPDGTVDQNKDNNIVWKNMYDIE